MKTGVLTNSTKWFKDLKNGDIFKPTSNDNIIYIKIRPIPTIDEYNTHINAITLDGGNGLEFKRDEVCTVLVPYSVDENSVVMFKEV
jgi:hypothetical protein